VKPIPKGDVSLASNPVPPSAPFFEGAPALQLKKNVITYGFEKWIGV